MKIKKFVGTLSLFILTLTFWATSSFGQKRFENLPLSKDSSYGYSAESPILLKRGNPKRSIQNSKMFLSRLRTDDNQTLNIIAIATVISPNHKEPKIKLTNRYTGMPLNGDPGILDKYIFVTSRTKDTIGLYVDIYNKGDIKIPLGLKYKEPEK